MNTILDNQAIQRIKQDISSKNISHAYLFCGPDNFALKEAAKFFAKSAICGLSGVSQRSPQMRVILRENCTCEICRRIENGHHPDYLFFEPIKNSFGINQIRDIIKISAIDPMESNFRIIVINNAGAMTEPAANAFLKSLEEPLSSVIYILIADDISSILPTIISRARHLRIGAANDCQIDKFLVRHYSINKQKALVISNITKGNLGKAINFATNSGHLELRSFVLQIFTGLVDDIMLFVERLVTICKKTADKNCYNEALDFLTLWLRDIVIFKETGDKKLLVNADYFDDIEKKCQNIDISKALDLIEKIKKTQKYLNANVNAQLALESLFLQMVETEELKS